MAFYIYMHSMTLCIDYARSIVIPTTGMNRSSRVIEVSDAIVQSDPG